MKRVPAAPAVRHAEKTNPLSGLDAFEATLPEMLAIPKEKVIPVNAETWNAAQVVFKAIPEIAPYRDEIESKILCVDITKIDSLQRYALASNYVNGGFKSLADAPTDVSALYAKARGRRDTWLGEAQVAVSRGHIEPSRLNQISTGTGFRNTSSDLTVLVNIFRSVFEKLEGKTFVTKAEIDETDVMANELSIAAAQRDAEDAVEAKAADLRARAFTLLSGAYGEAIRGIACLRFHEGDAKGITPSLHAGQGGGGKKDAAPVAAPVAAPAAPAPAVATPDAAHVAPVGLGHPNANPFTS